MTLDGSALIPALEHHPPYRPWLREHGARLEVFLEAMSVIRQGAAKKKLTLVLHGGHVRQVLVVKMTERV